MKRYSLIALFYFSYISAFPTLSELNHEANGLPEYPENASHDWIYPNYAQEYKRLRPSLFRRLLRKNSYEIAHFIDDITTIITADQKNVPNTSYILKLTCQPESKIYILSTLHAGFHSLMRILNWFKINGILDENLKILSPNHYFIINGDAINYGVYNISTLSAIITLMHANPKAVFYLKGKEENKEFWVNGTMKVALSMSTFDYSKSEKLLNQFFDTLPLGVYITTPTDSSYIRVSPTGRTNSLIPEKLIYPSLAAAHEAIAMIPIAQLKTSLETTLPSVIAIIKADNWQEQPQAQTGLGLLGQDQGSTAWSIFSSAIEAHQKLLNVKQDAFGEITIKSPLSESTLSLYTHDIKEKSSDFKKVSTYNLKSARPDIDHHENEKNTFSIGSTMANQVQGVADMGKRTELGMFSAINAINQQGGIHNTFIRVVVLNDDYIPSIARKNIETLLSQGIDTILLPVGSPTLDAYMDYIKSGKVYVFFPITGAPQFRNKEIKGLYHFRGTYYDEVRALVDHIVTEGAAHKFAFFYQNDAYGKGALKAAHDELNKKKITDWVDIPYQRNSLDYKVQAQQIKDAQADAIGLFGTAQAGIELIRQLGVDSLTNKQLFGISFVGEESFRSFLKKHGLKILLGAVVPNPNTSNLEIVKEYRAVMNKNKKPYDIFSLEAYIATAIFLDAIAHASLPITKEKIAAQIESYKNYQFKGLSLTFHPGRHDLAESIWLESGSNEEWKQKTINKEESYA